MLRKLKIKTSNVQVSGAGHNPSSRVPYNVFLDVLAVKFTNGQVMPQLAFEPHHYCLIMCHIKWFTFTVSNYYQKPPADNIRL